MHKLTCKKKKKKIQVQVVARGHVMNSKQLNHFHLCSHLT